MKIYASGSAQRLAELKDKMGAAHVLHCENRYDDQQEHKDDLTTYDLIFDLNCDDDGSRLPSYAVLHQKPVVVCAVKKSLQQLREQCRMAINCHLIGMNTLPSFINRYQAEVSFSNIADADKWKELAALLHWEYFSVADKVGMVTPRVIAMVINEACNTLQENTATITDIEMAMKLGTNYPRGPFEWCNRIGIKEVYEILEAVAKNTGEQRYKMCDLLKNQYLKQEPFLIPISHLK